MVEPKLLKAGDTVAIVAPGRKIEAEHVEFARHLLQSWGLHVTVAKNFFNESHTYLAGSDEERAEDLQLVLNDPNVKGIICARGGYGTTRIVDQLDFASFLSNPKWIVGFSDITSLHLKLLGLGVKSIHATMPILFSKADSKPSIDSLRTTLFKGAAQMEASSSTFNRLGVGSGTLVGGNLSLVIDSLGTATEPDLNGKIFIIEEVDEYRYKMDRMLTQLRRGGKLKGLKGIVVGHLTSMHETDPNFAKHLEEIVLYAARDYNYPVAFGFPIGHENPNLAWVHGASATLEVTAGRSLLTYSK
jgi:muramoyltetrapeptide carboxypeptidase